MQTKLTLRLDESLIQQAKIYAKQHEKSLSQVVADYFQALNQPSPLVKSAPITQSLIGILENSAIDESDYSRHLEDKYF